TVQHLTSTRPLLLVLEDLHWADEMTLRLLVFLARRVLDWPALIVATARIEEMADAPTLRRTIAQLGRQPRSFSSTLAPLSQTETVTLVRALSKAGMDDAVVQQVGEQVWRASEGNPFMIVETVRALHEGERIDPTGPLLTPPRVREMITARLDRLS